jgi:hypothetical protein
LISKREDDEPCQETYSIYLSLLPLKSQANFRNRYLLPALKSCMIEMSIPGKPNSRLQKYRLTDNGRAVLAKA